MNKKYSAFFWYAVLSLSYIILSLILPVSQQTLHQLRINTGQYHVVIFLVLLPYTLIWFSAFFAYTTLDAYTRLLDNTRETAAFLNIAKGVRVMAWGLALPAIISTVLKSIGARHLAFMNTAIIISNYLTLAVPLIAFTFIGNGSRILSDLVKVRPNRNGIRAFALLFILFGVYYTVLTLTARKYHGNPYHLTYYVTMLTIIVPYLYAWFMGLMACYEIVMYSAKIKGLLYKRALNRLAGGVAIVVGSSVFIQFINVVYAYKTTASLGALLILIYLLLAVMAIGYVFIATGAKNLKRIEEI